MNESMNVNIMPVPFIMPSNILNTNNTINMDKGAFLKMMAALINENTKQNTIATEETVKNFNLIEISAGNDISNLINTENILNNSINIESILSNSINTESSPSNSINVANNLSNLIYAGNTLSNSIDLTGLNLHSSDEITLEKTEIEDNSKSIKDNLVNNVMNMVSYFNPAIEKINFEKLSKENIKDLNAYNNPDMNINTAQYIKHGSINQVSTAKDNVQVSTLKDNVQEFKLTDGQPHLSIQAEKLIVEIEGNKNKLKSEINFNVEMLSPKEPIIQGENAIITVSDESSNINSQVLAQVKDKIVFMVDEGKGEGNIKQVTMELQPHNLGKVDIKMTFEDNKITVEVKALNEETQKILSTNAKELANILSKTTESSINVVVKNYESHFEHNPLNNQSYEQRNYENYEQRNNENYNQDNGHSRQRNYYTDENKKEDKEDDSIFSQLINLRNIKL
ncbi:MAG: flagellar hook-length control protein FliK [Sedimentibacter sp.]